MMFMDDSLFSIIVPTYNPNEEYFLACLRSILRQKNCQIEIVVIANGPITQNVRLMDKILELDDRIRVIILPVANISSARNEGIRQSKGKYLVFVDDDDEMIDDWALSKSLFAFSEGVDWCVFAYSEDACPPTTGDNPLFCDISDSFFSTNNPLGIEKRSVWAKVYIKALLDKDIEWFDPKIKSGGEDVLFNVQYATKSHEAAVFASSMYFHRNYAGSTTYRFNPNVASEYTHLVGRMIDISLRANRDPHFAYFYFVDQLICNIAMVYYSHPDNRRPFFQRACSFRSASGDRLFKKCISIITIREIKSGKKKVTLLFLKLHFYVLAMILFDFRYRHR